MMVAARRALGVLFLLVFCLVAGASAGEKVKFGHLTIEDGLPETGVITMLQDRLGFLWLGTQNGLTRYDGYSFTTYKPDPNEPGSIGGRLITALYEDSAGVLWVGSRRGGLNRFDRVTDSFVRYQHDPADSTSLSFDAVSVIVEDSVGNLWVGTGDMESKTALGGLNRFDPETGTFTRFLHDSEDAGTLSHSVVLDIHQDGEGQLWVATAGGGLNRFDPETGISTRFVHDDQDPGSLAHDFVPSLAEDQDGYLWIATSGGLDRLDRSSGEFEHFRHDPEERWSLSSNYVSTVFVDRAGVLWVGTWEGVLHRFYPSYGTFGRFEHNTEDPHSLTANSAIMTIYQDRADILWIGTWGGGLNKLDPFAGKFPHYGHEPDNPNSLSDDRVTAFHEDRAGNLWIGTRGGLNRHNPNSDTYTHYRHDADDPTSLGSDRIHDVLEDANGTLWIGTESAGLDRFNPDGETFAHYRHDPGDPESLSGDHVESLLEDTSETLWVGTAQGGLNRYDRSTGKFTAYQSEDSASGGPSYMRVLYQDRDGAMWIGTGGGLSLFDPTTGSFTTYYEPLTGLDIITSIHEDSTGRLWVGTFNGGLHLFDRQTGTSRPFTQSDGLAHDTVFNVLEDDQGRLWIATGNGVTRFSPETESFRTYGVADGLQTHQFAGGAIRTREGQMLFGAKNGINAFYPDHVEDNPYPPEVVLTKVKVGNVVLEPGEDSPLDRHISVAEQLNLDSDQNALSFSFAALHFGQPDQNRYAYRLEPVDEEWIQAGTRRHASYLNLAPGNYEFRVRAANGDGVWNEEGASVRVTIQPPWWRTWWAYGLFGLLALAVVITIDRLLRRRVVQRERDRAREQEARLRTETAEAKAKAAAAEARALRIENERTAQELEEARNLQLSMLPERLPTHPNLEIATYMKTASEVGGDYYDFDLAPDGTLTVAIGDATGHGTKAGTMVTATKVLFNLLAAEPDSVKVLQESTRVIRQLNMQNLFMALALAKLKGNHLEIAGAGMPPTLIRRAASDDVEEVHLEGAPLGSFSDFPYQVASVELLPGDTIMMMSDGLPEMIGGDDEVFGYERLGSILKEAGPIAPQDVIDRFSEVAEGWANGRPQDDDVTMIVMRLKAA
jgi:ligand-binding sensor domain-containing protein/serine phosphatase RsbU (regulator of sigma subunit)